VIALLALARRDFLIARSYRLPFVADLTWGLVDLALFYFISRVVGPDPAADLQGAPSYFAFAVAGILLSLMIGSATSDIASRIRDEQLTGTLELLCAQPLRAGQLAAGYAAFPIAYAAVRVALYLVVAVLVFDLGTEDTDWVGVVVMLAVSALAFFGLGVLAAAAVLAFKQGEGVVDAAVFAMTFVSGALFPLSVLPDWLEAIGRVMPTSFAFEGLRDALFAGGGWGVEALVLLAIAAVGLPLATWVFARALRHAKRRGNLAEY
jgi:ABC-type multidrug transport system permease subunit